MQATELHAMVEAGRVMEKKGSEATRSYFLPEPGIEPRIFQSQSQNSFAAQEIIVKPTGKVRVSFPTSEWLVCTKDNTLLFLSVAPLTPETEV